MNSPARPLLKCRRRPSRQRRRRGGEESSSTNQEANLRNGTAPQRRHSSERLARPSIGRHGGSYERSKLVGPGLSRGARQGCRRQRLPRMEPGHLQCRQRARSRPEAQGRAGASKQEGQRWPGTKPLTAYWMHDVIRISEPLTIGKHAWRLVQYRGLGEPLHCHRRGDQDWPVRRDACDLRRLRVAAPRRAIRGLATSPGLAEGTTSTMDSIAACPAACASSTPHAHGLTPPHADGTGTQASHGNNEGEGPTGAAPTGAAR